MARQNRELTVEFKGDTRDLERAADQSERALAGVGKAASGPGGLFSKLTPVIDPISLATQGLSALASAGLDMVKAASEDAKSARALEGVLRNVTHATRDQVDATEDWISKQSLAVGIADDELRPAYAKLIAATKDTATTQRDMQLAWDISAGTGKEFATIVDALVKAENGNLSSLAKLGIATKDQEGNTRSLADIVAELQGKYQGLGETVANEDPLNKAQIAWDELKESIGSFLLPVLATAVDWFITKVYPVLQEFWRRIHDEVVPVIRDELWPALKDLVGALADLVRAFLPANDGASDLDTVIGLLRDSVHLAAIQVRILADGVRWLATTAEVTTAVIRQTLMAALDDLIGAVLRVVGWFQKAPELITNAWGHLGQFIGSIADRIENTWRALFDWIRKAWNATIGGLSLHIPGTGIGFDIPEIPAVPRAVGLAATSAGGAGMSAPTVVVQLPPGADGHTIVAQLRTYGVRVGPLSDLAVAATR